MTDDEFPEVAELIIRRMLYGMAVLGAVVGLLTASIPDAARTGVLVCALSLIFAVMIHVETSHE